jgi:2-polyprenyl-6-methoxyphenol hydroxylase-like FAD-dependent oxidoreductase
MAFDAIVIGGGLAGSAFAGQLARAGHRILVLEREERFKDRVRGECMSPWGVAAARRMGLMDDLVAAGGRTLSSWITYALGKVDELRDLSTTTPHGEPALNLYHPDLQEALLGRAVLAGADVRRGATVTGLDAGPGRLPAVTFEQGGKTETISARIVVGADGRASQVRRWAGFEVSRSPDLLTIAGTLFTGCDVPDDAVHLTFGPGIASLVAPLGGKRARAYFVYPGVAGRRGLSGPAKVDEFVGCCQAAGFPESWFAAAESDGPLAEFDGADRWVAHPAKNGVVLIGDAAASTDPSWGQGLALTMVDVEHLTNALRSSADWSTALDRYAGEHDEYFAALQRILGWMTELVWTAGPEADARRGRVFPRMKADPTGFPDFLGTGPFGPNDENARRLILGLA